MTFLRTLPPQSILKLLPFILHDIAKCTPVLGTAVKLLTGHYTYYYQFYAGGVLDSVYILTHPAEKEIVYISLLFSWLLEALPKVGKVSLRFLFYL